MSYQSRSRAKTITDLSSVVGMEGTGTCCLPDGGDGQEMTYYECLAANGAFFPELDASCPSLGVTGCCCACNHVDNFDEFYDNPNTYSGGLKITTKCNCEALGGNFAVGIDCDSFVGSEDDFCKRQSSNNSYDVRYPYACCHPEINSDNEMIGWDCENTCTAKDCLDLAPLPPPCDNVYFGLDLDGLGNGRMCDRIHPDFSTDPVNCDLEDCSSPGNGDDGNGDVGNGDNGNGDGGNGDGGSDALGACCIQGFCYDDLSPSECTYFSGIYQGDNTSCSTLPDGACEEEEYDCFSDPEATGCCCLYLPDNPSLSGPAAYPIGSDNHAVTQEQCEELWNTMSDDGSVEVWPCWSCPYDGCTSTNHNCPTSEDCSDGDGLG